jgi:hypothetical protein
MGEVREGDKGTKGTKDKRYEKIIIVSFEILTVVVTVRSISWDIMPLKVNRTFGGTFHLHFQD